MKNNWWNIDSEDVVIEPAIHKCSDCYYWTGNPGNMPEDFICAVNIPQPSVQELDLVDGRKSYAYQNCPDFKEN